MKINYTIEPLIEVNRVKSTVRKLSPGQLLGASSPQYIENKFTPTSWTYHWDCHREWQEREQAAPQVRVAAPEELHFGPSYHQPP